MAASPRLRRQLRYAVPGAAVLATVAVSVLPQAASGTEHPALPTRTAAQLLAAIEQAQVPDFSGTTVETSRLGLPSLPEGALSGLSGGGGSAQQVVTLLTGSHTARLAYAGPDQQRVAIFLDDLSETDVVHNGADVWTYSSQGNAVTHTTLRHDAGTKAGAPEEVAPLDPTQAAEQALAKIDPSTAVTVDPTARVAGRSAYQLVLAPRDAQSLIGTVRIAVDAATSMPLRVQVWPRSGGAKPAFEVGFTSLTLRTPSASTFAFSVPPGATVNANSKRAAAPSSQKGDAIAAAKAAGADGTGTTTASGTTTFGKDWLTVVTGTLPKDTGAGVPVTTKRTTPGGKTTTATRAGGDSLTSVLDQMATPVPGGKLISTALISVLITDDGHYYAGMVAPSYLESVAKQAQA